MNDPVERTVRVRDGSLYSDAGLCQAQLRGDERLPMLPRPSA